MRSLSLQLLLIIRLLLVTSGWLVANKHWIWHLFLLLSVAIAFSTTSFSLILILLTIDYNRMIDLIWFITLRIIKITYHVYIFNHFSRAATVFCFWDSERRLPHSLWRFWVIMLLHLLLEGALVLFAAIDLTAITVYEDSRGDNVLLCLFRACIGHFIAFVCGKIHSSLLLSISLLIWIRLVRRAYFRTATFHHPIVPLLSLRSFLFLIERVLILFIAVFLSICIILNSGALLEHFEHQFADRLDLESLLNDILVL